VPDLLDGRFQDGQHLSSLAGRNQNADGRSYAGSYILLMHFSWG
jgi:hypothetical protein